MPAKKAYVRVTNGGLSTQIDCITNGNGNATNIISRLVTAQKVDTPEKLVAWLLHQKPDRQEELNMDLTGIYYITYHTETLTELESGQQYPSIVVDSVDVSDLPAHLTESMAALRATNDAVDNIDDIKAILNDMSATLFLLRKQQGL